MLFDAYLSHFMSGDEHGIQENHSQHGFRRPRLGQLPGAKPLHQSHGPAQQHHQLAPRRIHPAQPLHRGYQRGGRPSLSAHSTFSRFRGRRPKPPWMRSTPRSCVSSRSRDSASTIEVAVGAHLVKSTSRPLSNDGLKKQREQRQTQEGQRDKNGKPLKFSRDLESDCVIKYDTPHFGLKEHMAVDSCHGFVLATTLTPASVNDTNRLPYCTAISRHTKQKIKKVFADKGYAGKPNRTFWRSIRLPMASCAKTPSRPN
jgi:hypothetical protein